MAHPVPTRIDPIFSPRPWGARSLAPIFPDKINLQEPLGEAWLTGHDCPVATGPFAGKTLKDAWLAMPVEWRGLRFASCAEFPVLAKFIFPTDKLSVQVHPDDAYASLHEKAAGGRGKTEMWHIVSARPGAHLLLGTKPGLTREKFLADIEAQTVEEDLLSAPVHRGDTFFIPAGTLHAIHAGVVICEIQEYSDLTYRVYDYGRVDSAGKPRALHIEKALAIARFGDGYSGKVAPLALHSPDGKKYLLAACEYFATERWDCQKTTFIESDPQQFQLLVILDGAGTLHDTEASYPFRAGECWFLPANLDTILFQPAGPTALLRVIVPDPATLRDELKKQGFGPQAVSRVLV